MAKRTGRLVLHKFYQYLGPGLLFVIAMQLGSLASSVIIGQTLGAEVLTAASLAVSFVILSELPGLALPVGLSIVISKLFSQRRFKEAKQTFNTTLVIGLAVSVLFIPVGLFLTPYIADFLSGSFPNYAGLVSDFLSVFFYCSPLFFVSLLFCNLLAADNHPGLSAMYFLISTIVHIVLEILFCLLLPKEHIMVYVALSFELSFVVGFILLIPYLRSKSRLMEFGFGKLSFSSFKPVLKSSLTTVLSFGLQGVMMLLLMKTATSAFTSESEMNAYAVIASSIAILDLFATGIIQMLPPITSSLYGEKDYTGIRFVVSRILLLSLISTGLLTLVTLIYPDVYLLIFGIAKESVSPDFGFAMRLYAISFIFYMLNKFIQSYYPSVFSGTPGIINTLLEKGVAGIPLTVGLMFAFSVKGYSLGISIAEAVSFGLTILFVYFYGKKKKGTNSLLLLPRSNPDEPRFELSVASIDEVEDASSFVQKKVLEANGSQRSATYLSLGAEELLLNSFQYGYSKNKKSWGIDLILAKQGNSFLLSLKDDGIPFDPIAHKEDDGPEAIFHGLPLLKKVSSRLEYVRIINLNETIMEMDEAN